MMPNIYQNEIKAIQNKNHITLNKS